MILNVFPQSVSGRDRRERRYIFDPVWRRKEEYREVVSRVWLRSPIGGDGQALRGASEDCAQALRVWGRKTFGQRTQ